MGWDLPHQAEWEGRNKGWSKRQRRSSVRSSLAYVTASHSWGEKCGAVAKFK